MFAEEFVIQDATGHRSEAIADTLSHGPSLIEGLPIAANQLVSLIESQLSQSFVYRRAVESLQQLMANDSTDGQMLLKVVGLEAIRLTLQAVEAHRPTLAPAASIGTPVVAPVSTVAVTVLEDTALDADAFSADALNNDALDNDLFEAIAAVTQPGAPSHPLSHLFDRYKAKRQIAAESVKVFTRAEILTQIGAQIQLEREQKGLTIAQLHARTFIPMYHLQAFEGGHVEQLPEDVYLRGFLRRIENALGLEVGSLIEKLPNDQTAPSIVPSWSGHGANGTRRGVGGLDINPNHLYVTYAAIMAGGVCWLSNQTSPTAANLPDFTNYEPRAEAPSAQMQASQPNLNRFGHKIGNVKSTPAQPTNPGAKNMAPPETLR
jgi:cytoskeleton protein RodZ